MEKDSESHQMERERDSESRQMEREREEAEQSGIWVP